MKEISAVSLDVDNTLFDRDACATSVLKRWIVRSGRDVSLEECVKRDQSGHSNRHDFLEWLSQQLRERKSLQEFQSELIQAIQLNLALVRSVEAIMAAKHIDLYVLSDGEGEVQREKLKRLGLTDLISSENIFISGETGHRKPALQAFVQLTTEKFRPSKKILHIGDHLEKDIRGAQSAGMQTCYVGGAKLGNYNYSITSVDELPEFLVSLLS